MCVPCPVSSHTREREHMFTRDILVLFRNGNIEHRQLMVETIPDGVPEERVFELLSEQIAYSINQESNNRVIGMIEISKSMIDNAPNN